MTSSWVAAGGLVQLSSPPSAELEARLARRGAQLRDANGAYPKHARK